MMNPSVIQEFSATWSMTDASLSEQEMTQTTSSSSSANPTLVEVVKLDVGGTKFKVSRSLIEQYPNTMLARLVSSDSTWHQPPKHQKQQQHHHDHRSTDPHQQSEIFIDRDGETFRLVLTYMRDHKVYVPMKLAKKTILTELEYFGFDDVDEDVIHSGCTRIQAATSLALYNKIHLDRVEELKYTQHYEILAYECFKTYYTTGSLEDIRIDKTNNERFAMAPHITEWNDRIFDKCLAEYGLLCKTREMEPNQFLVITCEAMI
jgi:hypothetical protein